MSGGEPCLVPIIGNGSSSNVMPLSGGSGGKNNLLSDARAGNLCAMRKRMRNSIFKRCEDVNQRDERHCTPMHYAAKRGHIEMIR